MDYRNSKQDPFAHYGQLDWVEDCLDADATYAYTTLEAPGLGDVEKVAGFVRALAYHAFFGVLLVEAADLAQRRFLSGGLRGAPDGHDVRCALYAWQPDGPWVRAEAVRMSARYLGVRRGELEPAWSALATELRRREPDERERCRRATALVRAVGRSMNQADEFVLRDVARRVGRAQRMLLALGEGDAWDGIELVAGDDVDIYVDAFLRYETVVELLDELPLCLEAGT